MSGGTYFWALFMYSGKSIETTKKKYLMSNIIYFAPLSALEITLLGRIFVSNKFAAGEPGLSGYKSLSLPRTRRVPHYLDFDGLCSQTKLAYIIFAVDGISLG